MRWYIADPKRKIETVDLEGHSEFLEMSGERVSGLVTYGVQSGKLTLSRDIVFPNFRTQPNNTHGSHCTWGIQSPELLGEEIFDKAQINGVLTLYSHTEAASVKRIFYPSTTLSCFYEDVEITAENGDVKRPSKVSIDIFRNGELYKNVELTAAKNWAYTWETDGTYAWTAVERNIPSGYTVSIQSKDGRVQR